MQIKVVISEQTFASGEIMSEKIEPPVIEFTDKDGWLKRAKISEIDKFKQFSGINKSFLSALMRTADTYYAKGMIHE